MLYGGVICHIVLMVGSNQITSQEHSAGRCAGGGGGADDMALACSINRRLFLFLASQFPGFCFHLKTLR